MTESERPKFEGSFWLDDWHVVPDSGRLVRQGAEVRLEPKVMSLLVLLSNNAGDVMSREAIEYEVWKDVVVGYDALASSIIKLRKALGDNSREPRYIETVSKKGYRLIAQVSRAQPPVMNSRIEAPQRKKNLLLLSGLILLGVIVVTYALIRFFKQDFNHVPDSATAARPEALMVMPFANLGDDPSQEYFSEGITEDLITDLSQYSRLKVISHRTTLSYKNRDVSLKTLPDELGVRYVVEGSTRKDGNRVRINVQLIDALSGVNLWAERYDREIVGLFNLQDEVRKKIVSALKITLTEEERHREQKRYTNSIEAYDYFLQGQSQLVRRGSASDNDLAQQFMKKAIDIDPQFARAHAALALIYADAYRFDWMGDADRSRRLALASGQRALDLDPNLPQANWIMGYVYLFLFEDHAKALKITQRAIELSPENPDAINTLAVINAFGDDPQKAVLQMQELMQKNKSYSAMVPSVLGLAQMRLGHYSEALAALDNALMINPSRIPAMTLKAVVLYRMGKADDAEFLIDDLYNMHPDFDVNSWAAHQPFKDKAIAKDMLEDILKAGARR